MNRGLATTLLSVGVIALFAAVGWLGWTVNTPEVHAPDTTLPGRTVQVIFKSQVFDGLPVRFAPKERIQLVTPGVEHRNVYLFQNLSDETIYFRPIHSVAPAEAAQVFSMSVCFCFNDQRMPPGASAEFTVAYTLGKDLDDRVNPVHINYNLHAIQPDEFRPTKPGTAPSIESVIEAAEAAKQGGPQ